MGQAELAESVAAWIADDPDPATAAELDALRETGAWPELADRFGGLLQFGTAGLRGALGGGPNRMNRAVVIRAAAGVVTYLRDLAVDGATPRVVVGYDARHGSAQFALDTVAVAVGAGCEAYLLPGVSPTPVLAFAVRHLGADAGVMVTASHNPPQDNGYKVYLGGATAPDPAAGVQIVAPHDEEIARRIAAVPSVASVPRAESGWTVLGDDLDEAYLAAVARLDDGGPRDLRIALTSLHGVGGATVERVLRRAGFTDLHVVPQQAEPDPDFPTVAFPNPEEPGAIDLAVDLARHVGADLVLANDPDADRCAVAVHDPRLGGWRMLHGDEVGALLGDVVARRASPHAPEGSPVAPDAPVLANSIVSSRLLARIASVHGLRHTQTLTGFKWIARVDGLAYGYEEALGYCVAPDVVRDKDGISAALLVAQLAARLKAGGTTLIGALDDLARRYGLYLTDQLSARYDDQALIAAAMAQVRSRPPSSLVGSPVVEAVDLSTGSAAERGGLPATDGLRLLSADGTRVVVRPSGTEPKVKCYLEVVVPVDPDASFDDMTTARRTARARLDELKADVRAVLGL